MCGEVHPVGTVAWTRRARTTMTAGSNPAGGTSQNVRSSYVLTPTSISLNNLPAMCDLAKPAENGCWTAEPSEPHPWTYRHILSKHERNTLNLNKSLANRAHFSYAPQSSALANNRRTVASRQSGASTKKSIATKEKQTSWWRRLRALAELAGDSQQKDIAETLGVSASAVTSWRQGKPPSPENVQAAARAYGADPRELMRNRVPR
jgi:hypothetical protein